jgi:hypothetical protein
VGRRQVKKGKRPKQNAPALVVNQDTVLRLRGLSRRKMTPSLAREVLKWRYSKADRQRIDALLDENQEGTISPPSLEWLRTCVLMGDLVGNLWSKARVTLKT